MDKCFQRWFGMARGACGGNDASNPQTFLQIFRLLCSYSLVKPPKGSSVEGKDLLRTLMGTAESITSFKENKKDWITKIDQILDEAGPIDVIALSDM